MAVPTAVGAAMQDLQWITPVEIAPKGSDWPHLANLQDQLHLVFWSQDLPNHRWVSLSDQTLEGLGWSAAAAIPGWEAPQSTSSFPATIEGSPFALAADYLSLRLIAPIPGSTTINLSQWSYAGAESRWEQVEKFSPPGLWHNSSISAAMSPLSGGSFAVAWLALSEQAVQVNMAANKPQVFFTARQIPMVDVPPAPAITPKPTATSTPADTPTPIPTGTPMLSAEPDASSAPVSPLVIGTGLAALIVIAIFIGILVKGQKR